MNIRDPRWMPTTQLGLVVGSSFWIATFIAQDSHTSLSWVGLFLDVVVFVGSIFLILWGIWKSNA